MKDTLVFLASNHKGDELFKELAGRFEKSYYVSAGYASLPWPYRTAVRLLDRIGLSRRDIASLDNRLRASIARRSRRRLDVLRTQAGRPRAQLVFWHCLFPITHEWRGLARISVISDVPMIEDYFEHFRIRKPASRLLRERIRATTIENCDHFFAHSEWAAELNRSLYPAYSSKIFRIGWGSDMPGISREEALRARDRKRILCVGNDYYRKGVDFYDQVAGKLKDRIPGVECLVAGNPGRDFRVQSLRHLTVLGPVTRSQLSRHLKQASLFALFSRFEPAGHVTIEAMSYGVPVLCSNKGGIAEPVIDGVTGFVCPTFSVEDAVDRACQVLTDPARLAAFREQAYDHAHACWQWSHVAERLIGRLQCQETAVPGGDLTELWPQRKAEKSA